jgi:DNA primase
MSVAEEVKQRVDLVDLVSETIQLQKSGKNYKANCPFHNEKTPSFYVFPDRQYWHCFGACAEGGDVFNYVQKRDGVEFRDALRILAARAGVELRGSPAEKRVEDQHLERLRAANDAAAAFYQNLLLQSEAGAASLSYLQERGLDDRAIRDFQLGFAPGRGQLIDHLSSRGFASAEIIEAGLAIENESGVYDRFHDRIIFPIRDERGRVVGLGGRTTVDDVAKYLNTPQTPLFDKSGLLYALDRARDAIRQADEVVVVEGYMDVIAAHQFGYRNVLASMGTSLTEKQVATLKRLTRRIVLALDADAAGAEATMRGIEVASAAGDNEIAAVIAPGSNAFVRLQEQSATEIRILTIPEGKDPDELIRKEPQRWEALVAEAKPVIDHLLDRLPERYDVTDPRESGRAAREIIPTLAAIADAVVRDRYVQRLAHLIHVDESVLRDQLGKPSAARARVRRAEPPAAKPAASRSSEPVEEYLLALLLRFPSLRDVELPEPRSLLTLSVHQALYELWIQAGDNEDLPGLVPEELSADFERVRARYVPPLDDASAEAALGETVWKLQQRNIKRAKQVSADTIAEIEAAARGAGSDYAGLLAMLSRSESDLGDDELERLAQVYVEDYEKGLALHQLLVERYPGHEPLTDARKQAIRAALAQSTSHEDVDEVVATP